MIECIARIDHLLASMCSIGFIIVQKYSFDSTFKLKAMYSSWLKKYVLLKRSQIEMKFHHNKMREYQWRCNQDEKTGLEDNKIIPFCC